MKTRTKHIILTTAITTIASSFAFALGVLRGVEFADRDRAIAHGATAAMQLGALSSIRSGDTPDAIRILERSYNFNRSASDSVMLDTPLTVLRYIFTNDLRQRPSWIAEQKAKLMAYVEAYPETLVNRP